MVHASTPADTPVMGISMTYKKTSDYSAEAVTGVPVVQERKDIDHMISDADTLQLISLKYNVSEAEILTANSLLSVSSFEFLSTGTIITVPIVPGTVAAEMDPKTEKVIALCAKFMRRTQRILSRDAAQKYLEEHNWDEEAAYAQRLLKQEKEIELIAAYKLQYKVTVTPEESEFYLSENNYSVPAAVAALHKDMEWEKSNPAKRH